MACRFPGPWIVPPRVVGNVHRRDGPSGPLPLAHRRTARPVNTPRNDDIPTQETQEASTPTPEDAMQPQLSVEPPRRRKRVRSFSGDEEARSNKEPRTEQPPWSKKYDAYMKREDLEKAKQLRKEISKMKMEKKELKLVLRRVGKKIEHVNRERASWGTMREMVLDADVEDTDELVKDGISVLEKAEAERERNRVVEEDEEGTDDGASGIGDVDVDDEMLTGGYSDEDGGVEYEIDGEEATDEELEAGGDFEE